MMSDGVDNVVDGKIKEFAERRDDIQNDDPECHKICEQE